MNTPRDIFPGIDPGDLWFLGDCHGTLRHVLEALDHAARRPRALVFLGDMELRESFDAAIAPIEARGIEVWFIHGNHDNDDAEIYRLLFESSRADRNLHGRVVEVAGLRLAGLGGVFRGSIWYPGNSSDDISHVDSYEEFAAAQKLRWPKRLRDDEAERVSSGKLLLHRSTIFRNDWERLAAERADVLVTHEAPSCHPNGFVAIDELAACLGVQAAFHGHHHDNLDYRAAVPTLGFQPRGVGLRGISDLAGNCIRPGELDQRRGGRRR